MTRQRVLQAVVFAVLTIVGTLWLLREGPRPRVADARAEVADTASRATSPVRISPTTVPGVQAAARAASSRVVEEVGAANGSISFSRTPAEKPVRFQARASVGVWLPNQGRLRIALLDDVPDHAAARLAIDALAVDDARSQSRAPPVLELVFTPTAQAFTREELERASLVVRTADGPQATIDVLGSVQWDGSLPSPRSGLPLIANRIEMKLAGTGAGQYGDGKEAWDLSVSVPVTLRE